MDQRKEELKRLKKRYNRKKAKTVGLWRVIAVIILLAALVGWAAAGVLFVPQFAVASALCAVPADILDALTAWPWLLPAIAGGATAAFLLFAVIAEINHKKLKKSREFLDYRTLKITLRAEKDDR